MQVSLEEILSERERRAEVQAEMLKRNGVPLISFSMNIPGPEKSSQLIERAFDVGIDLIERSIYGEPIIEKRVERGKCGPVSFFSVSTDARELKAALVAIEDSHPLGRLFDMDVIDPDGTHLSRIQERGCIVCGAPGRACAAGRLHPLTDILGAVDGIMTDYFLSVDAAHIAALARAALVDEVCTAPKPGLVDPESRGSHSDMDVHDFIKSADALLPYFEECVKIGARVGLAESKELFSLLRASGLDAEKKMYGATCGKNTHKGAIFSFGIILGAIGTLLPPTGRMPCLEDILNTAARISKESIEDDLRGASGRTAGERAYIERGKTGIRGEAMCGFPTVREIALPHFYELIAEGKNKNDAGAITLLHLIKNVYDTCLYKRGGDEGVAYARALAKELLESKSPTLDGIRKMDAALSEKNLSPGGCADLLALTYFLYSLDSVNP